MLVEQGHNNITCSYAPTGNEKYLWHDIEKQTQELELIICAGK
jgi:hypothetical protein